MIDIHSNDYGSDIAVSSDGMNSNLFVLGNGNSGYFGQLINGNFVITDSTGILCTLHFGSLNNNDDLFFVY